MSGASAHPPAPAVGSTWRPAGGRPPVPLLSPHVDPCFSSLKNAEGRGRDNLAGQSNRIAGFQKATFTVKMSKSLIRA